MREGARKRWREEEGKQRREARKLLLANSDIFLDIQIGTTGAPSVIVPVGRERES